MDKKQLDAFRKKAKREAGLKAETKSSSKKPLLQGIGGTEPVNDPIAITDDDWMRDGRSTEPSQGKDESE